MAHTQFRRTCLNMHDLIAFYSNRPRNKRSPNAVSGVGEAKEAEILTLNSIPSFVGNEISHGTFCTVLKLIFDLAKKVNKYYVENLVLDGVIPQNLLDLVPSVRLGMSCLRGQEIWASLGVCTPSIQSDQDSGLDINICETEIVMSLLELGADQERATRTLANGKIDPTDALPAELEKLETDRIEANAADKATFEDNMRVSKKKDKGTGKRVRPEVSIAQQLIDSDAKKARIKELRLQAETASTTQNNLDKYMSDYFSISTARSALMMKKEKSQDTLSACAKAWILLMDYHHYVEPEQVETVQLFLATLGVTESEDLHLLHVEHVENIVSFLKQLSGEKFVNFLQV